MSAGSHTTLPADITVHTRATPLRDAPENVGSHTPSDVAADTRDASARRA